MKKKKVIPYVISIFLLCFGYILTRYIFFDVHGMKQLPFILFVCGIAVIAVSFITKTKWISVITALSYIGGFVVGVIFQTNAVDEGGGRTNNLWIIWTVVYICFVFLAIINELIGVWRSRTR